MRTQVIPLFATVFAGFCATVGCQYGPNIWTSEATEEMKIDTTGLERLEARTHNGGIHYRGRAGGETAVVVVVTKKGGGNTPADAEEALKAIEVYVEQQGATAKRLTWRWKSPRKVNWSASVGYRIDAPEGLALDAESHNGDIDASGIAADAKLSSHNGSIRTTSCRGNVEVSTHNGRVETESSGGWLRVETYNGRITAKYEGPELKLESHNGRIEADLARCAELRGDITSYNGGVTLTVGDRISAELTCTAYNGSIRCDAPWEVYETARGWSRGKLGQGGPKLSVDTHNGSIEIRKAGQ